MRLISAARRDPGTVESPRMAPFKYFWKVIFQDFSALGGFPEGRLRSFPQINRPARGGLQGPVGSWPRGSVKALEGRDTGYHTDKPGHVWESSSAFLIGCPSVQQ